MQHFLFVARKNEERRGGQKDVFLELDGFKEKQRRCILSNQFTTFLFLLFA